MKQLIIRMAVALLAAIALGASASAQVQPLDDAVISARSLNRGSQERQQVDDFVEALAGDLESAEPRIRQRARDRLLAPLQMPDASNAFRLAYSAALSPDLKSLASSSDPGVAMCALALAGSMGTESGATVLRDAIQSEQPAAIRYAAARGLGDMFSMPGGGALNESALQNVTQLMQESLEREEDILVAGRLALSLMSAPSNSPVSKQAIISVCRGMSEQVRRHRDSGLASDKVLGVLLTSIVDMRGEVTKLNVDRQVAVQAAEFAGNVLAFVGEELDEMKVEGLAGDAGSSMLASLASASEAVLVFAHGALKPGEQVHERIKPTVERAIEGGALGPAHGAIDEWIGEGGRLEGEPYRFNSKIFKTKG